MPKTLSGIVDNLLQTKSQTLTYWAEVLSASSDAGYCVVRLDHGGVRRCIVPSGTTVSHGQRVTVMRQTPDRRFVIVGGASGDSGAQSSSPAVAVVTTQTETHALDSASHTGTLASHQAPQFALLDGSRPFVGPIMINLTSIAAPFVLSVNAIGQLVTGLNADLLDGHEATYFSVAGIYTHTTR